MPLMRRPVRTRSAILLWITPLVMLVAVFSPSFAHASTAWAAHSTRANSPVHAQCSGWSYTPPSQCSRVGHDPARSTRTQGISRYNNDAGCNGYTEGTGEMMCKATTYDTFGSRVAIRKGFWTGSNGFGHDKALYYHNLWLQPALDTIHSGILSGSRSSEHYDVYHYDGHGAVDQYVWVVADNVDDDFQGLSTGDGHSVGLITGFCADSSDELENTCPDWVNSTL